MKKIDQYKEKSIDTMYLNEIIGDEDTVDDPEGGDGEIRDAEWEGKSCGAFRYYNFFLEENKVLKIDNLWNYVILVPID